MRELPSGTITLVFSDMEASTRLLQQLGSRWGDTLSQHRALLRAAYRGHGGHEMGTEGDSFFVVFDSAADAVQACIDGQRALAAHSWPAGIPVRVRMGMHTGTPVRHEEGYIGLDVHTGARIAASAHGGQVLVSEATRHAVQGEITTDISFLDLGWHRLKDLPTPIQLHQLTVADLLGEFPPVRSLGAPTNLPDPRTSVVGRAELVEHVCSFLRDGARLVTLTGPGGTGKTRLAVEVAKALEHAYPDGVFFAALAPTRDLRAAWEVIAGVLGVTGDEGPQERVSRHLAARRSLVVLDNLEQLPTSAEFARDLLEAAPRAVFVATSRRPLHVLGEREVAVPRLPLQAATALFAARASLVRSDFTLDESNRVDVEQLCDRLNGLPLAIELAAARTRLLSPAALLVTLADQLTLAGKEVDRPERQRTLRATIQWSYDLLPARDRATVDHLGTTLGGCSLDLLRALRPDEDPLDLVEPLVDASLLTLSEGLAGELRLEMLEAVRQFAAQQLAARNDVDVVHRRHAEHLLEVAGDAASRLRGPDHAQGTRILDREAGNLSVALGWTLEPGDPARNELGVTLVNTLAWFWYMRGHGEVATSWVRRAVALAPSDSARGRALHYLGVLQLQHGEVDAAFASLGEALTYSRAEADTDSISKDLSSIAVAARAAGDLVGARDFLEEAVALAREGADSLSLATGLSNLAVVELDLGQPDRAVTHLQEAVELDTVRGDEWGVAVGRVNLATAYLRRGDVTVVRHAVVALAAEAAVRNDPDLACCVLELTAELHADMGRARDAARVAGAADAVRRRESLALPEPDAADLELHLGPLRASVDSAEWERWTQEGAAIGLSALDEVVTLPD
ncbi:MAG: tetratricopeptide repeat protein [Acidimicrobiales bacterium]